MSDPDWEQMRRAVRMDTWVTRVAWILFGFSALAGAYHAALGHWGRVGFSGAGLVAFYFIARWEPGLVKDFHFEDER